MKTLKAGMIIALFLALFPALVAAKPPEPKGKLVYSDDFSDPTKSGLEDKVNAADYSRGFHAPGVYHLIPSSDNETRMALLPNQSYRDFTLELDLWDNSDDFAGDAAQGIVFRAQDQGNMYAVLINPRKGQYTIRKGDGGTSAQALVDWKASPLIKQRSDVNHLRVDAQGNQFTLYLNGEALDTFSDGAFGQGQVGLVTSNIDAVKPHMHFDNIRVYTAETTAAASPAQSGLLPSSGQSARSFLMLTAAALVLIVLGGWLRYRLNHGPVGTQRSLGR